MVCTFIKTREKRSIKIQLGHGKSLWDSARLISLLGAVMAGRDRCPPGLAWLTKLIPVRMPVGNFNFVALIRRISSRLELDGVAAMHINDVAIESHLLCAALLCFAIRIANWGHSASLKTFTWLKEQQFGFWLSRKYIFNVAYIHVKLQCTHFIYNK